MSKYIIETDALPEQDDYIPEAWIFGRSPDDDYVGPAEDSLLEL